MSSTASTRPEGDGGEIRSPEGEGEGEGRAESVRESVDFYFELMGELTTPAVRRADISVDEIQWEQCACCGQPAKISHYDLKRRERILVCGTCRPPGRPSVSREPTGK